MIATVDNVTQVVEELVSPKTKTKVVRYDVPEGHEDEADVRTLYVSKRAIAELGNPEQIRVTIEAVS